MMFFLSSRFGALADRLGPRFFMSVGPMIAGAGLLLLIEDRPATPTTSRRCCPGSCCFGLGPLDDGRAADRDRARRCRRAARGHRVRASTTRSRASRACSRSPRSGRSCLAQFASRGWTSRPRRSGRSAPTSRQAVTDAKRSPAHDERGRGRVAAPERPRARATRSRHASVSAFRVGIGHLGGLVILGGVVSARRRIRNPRRKVAAADCPGGAICGASEELARDLPHVRLPQRRAGAARAVGFP